MKKFATIFRILNSINDSTYISLTEENLEICFEKKLKIPKLQKEVEKIGIENFKIEKIDKCTIENKDRILKAYIENEFKFNKNCLN